MNNENDILIIDRSEIDILKSIQTRSYTGYVYIIQWDDNFIKIGCAQNPHRRISNLISKYERYGNIKMGKIAISKEHVNYSANEKRMHNVFSEFRKRNTELFNVDFDKAVYQLSQLSFKELTKDVEKSIDQRNEKRLEGFKKMTGWISEINQEIRKKEDEALVIETTCDAVEYIRQLIDMKEFIDNPPCRLLLIAALSNVIAEQELLPLDYEVLKSYGD